MDKTATAMVVLALETIGLLFVGLVAAAGFAVMAQRRLRALGMLGALGATDGQVRLAMVANGTVVGVVGAVTGAVLGLATWIALAPRFEGLVNHRVGRFHLQWWAIVAAMVLAVVTAVVAAWWPARAAARSSIVAALSGRPSPPKPAHRFAGAGVVLLAVGFGCLAFAHPNSERPSPVLIIGGTVAITFGMLFVGPLFIRGLAALGRRAPIALRLALRDLARYQARSAAALGAISLALAIAATVAISAAAAAVPPAEANLANNQIVVSLSSGNGSAPREGSAPISEPTAAELRSLQARVDALAASLHAQAVIPLTEAVDQASTATSAARHPSRRHRHARQAHDRDARRADGHQDHRRHARSTSRRPRCSRTTESVRAPSTRTPTSSPGEPTSRALRSSRPEAVAPVRVMRRRPSVA